MFIVEISLEFSSKIPPTSDKNITLSGSISLAIANVARSAFIFT